MANLTTSNPGKQLSRSTFFSMTQKSGVLVVRPIGPRLGECEASIVAPEVKRAMQDLGSRLKGLILDLSQIEVVSSYGLGLCIELRNQCKGQRAGTVLVGMNPEIRELFRIMKLDRLFTIPVVADDVVAALTKSQQ